jgi:hypothetical protein
VLAISRIVDAAEEGLGLARLSGVLDLPNRQEWFSA